MVEIGPVCDAHFRLEKKSKEIQKGNKYKRCANILWACLQFGSLYFVHFRQSGMAIVVHNTIQQLQMEFSCLRPKLSPAFTF